MKKIGLALSGGGFRASVYHLGLIRFLRDAGLLSQVSHITSVSGGSIIAAHLVLNWDRYNGSPNEFDAAASEFLSFVRLDVRNRITRRFLLNIPLRWPRWLLGFSNRKLTRTGLLEYHYEQYLYGDTSLFQLPEKPQLHILTTNLSEGCLCSFNRNGLLMVRRQPGHLFRLDHIHAGLATVPMAVAASSAFPGFFPPVELSGTDVGASGGAFGRPAYTDGGVFDNLGVRMFRCLERRLLAESPLSRDDFVDFQAVVKALKEASQSSEETPLRRLAQLLPTVSSGPGPSVPGNGGASSNVLPPSAAFSEGNAEERLVSGLGELLRHYHFHREPLFVRLTPVDPDVEALLQASRLGERVLDADDQLWLNRNLLEAAFRQATGRACFRGLSSGLDGILVSDVGKRITVEASRRTGGLIRTALRATDILMDRVWQLETDTFHDTPGFVFAPITDVIEPAEDPTALHPEIQRQVANIRTDLDRSSLLEISSLVRHGYCVGRRACRARPDLFGADLPTNAPWDPIPGPRGAAAFVPSTTRLDGPSREPVATMVEARTLQDSAIRRIWSTLLDYRDWTSYVYVPLLVPILILLPYLVVKSFQRSLRVSQLTSSFAQSLPDLEMLSYLLDNKPAPRTGKIPEEVQRLDEPDFKGFEILQDASIFDLRKWKPIASETSESTSLVFGYRRWKVFKQPEIGGSGLFRVRLIATNPKTTVWFPPQQLQPRLRMSYVESSVPGQKECRWEVSYDFQQVTAREFVDLIAEFNTPGRFVQSGEYGNTLDFTVQAPTHELTMWILMPEGRVYKNFRVTRQEPGEHGMVEKVQIVSEYLASDSTVIAFKLLALKVGYTYRVGWIYE